MLDCGSPEGGGLGYYEASGVCGVFVKGLPGCSDNISSLLGLVGGDCRNKPFGVGVLFPKCIVRFLLFA